MIPVPGVSVAERGVKWRAIDPAEWHRMTFLHPVKVGEVMTLRAAVNAVWRMSLEVGVRVQSEDPLSGEVSHTSSAYVTMVAIDEGGRPVPAPPLNRTGAERAAASGRLNCGAPTG